MEEINTNKKELDSKGNPVELAWKVYYSVGPYLNYLCVLAFSEEEARQKLIEDMKDKSKWSVDTSDFKVLNPELLGEFIR